MSWLSALHCCIALVAASIDENQIKFILCPDGWAGNLLTAMCFDGVEVMEKEVRENKTRCGFGEQESATKTGGAGALGFSVSSYALPIQILRLVLYGDHSSSSAEAFSDDSASDDEAGWDRRGAGALMRRYCGRRVGKSVERLCIDLEHEGRPTWALREARRALRDADVQGSYHIGFNKRSARLVLSITKKEQKQRGDPAAIAAAAAAHFPSLDDMLRGVCGAALNEAAMPKSIGAAPSALNLAAVSSITHSNSSSRMRAATAVRVSAAWACPGCTLLNSARYWKCTLCHADRVVRPQLQSLKRGGVSPAATASESLACACLEEESEDEDDSLEDPPAPRRAGSRGRGKRAAAPPPPRPLAESKRARLGLSRSARAVVDAEGVENGAQATPPSSPPPSLQASLALQPASRPATAVNSGELAVSGPRAYITTPLTEGEMKQLLFNGQGGEFTTASFQQMVRTVAVAGRRLGSMRPGKNRLIGECIVECLLL